VVEFLLTKHPDVKAVEPTWNNTLLESAQYGGHPAVLALIRPLFERR